jgi:hypothetical protein
MSTQTFEEVLAGLMVELGVENPQTASGKLILPPPEEISRRTDPETSHLAAREIDRSGSRQSQAAMILSLLQKQPGLTAGECAAALGFSRGIPAAHKRLNDLHRKHLVYQGPARRDEVSGNQMMTWWPT